MKKIKEIIYILIGKQEILLLSIDFFLTILDFIATVINQVN